MSRCREVFPDHPAARHVTAEQVREVPCPRCQARPGAQCVNEKTGRERAGRAQGKSHMERLYIAQGHLHDCLPFLMDGGHARRHVNVAGLPSYLDASQSGG